jgi:hypothetical protein
MTGGPFANQWHEDKIVPPVIGLKIPCGIPTGSPSPGTVVPIRRLRRTLPPKGRIRRLRRTLPPKGRIRRLGRTLPPKTGSASTRYLFPRFSFGVIAAGWRGSKWWYLVTACFGANLVLLWVGEFLLERHR